MESSIHRRRRLDSRFPPLRFSVAAPRHAPQSLPTPPSQLMFTPTAISRRVSLGDERESVSDIERMLSPLSHTTCVQRSALAKSALIYHTEDLMSQSMVCSEQEFCSDMWPSMGRRPVGLDTALSTVWACALLYGPVAAFPHSGDANFWIRDINFVMEPCASLSHITSRFVVLRACTGTTVLDAMQQICDPVIQQNKSLYR
jgi:hypothetical protein